MSQPKRSQQESQIPDVLVNMTQQSRIAAAGGKDNVSTQVVKKTVGKLLEGVTTVVKQGATQAKNFVSEKIVIELADVLIIGGGLSGLTAAEAILEKSKTLRVFVLESSERLGGRVRTDEVHVASNTFVADSGGSWFSKSAHPTVMRMCERFGIDTVAQYGNQVNEGRHVVVRGTPESRRTFHGDIPAYSMFSIWEIQFRVLRKIEFYAKKLPLDDPWTLAEAKDLDKESVASFFDKKLRTATAKCVVDSTIMQLFGCNASQISLLHFLYVIRCSGQDISKLLATNSDGCHGTRMVGGCQQMCEKLAETIKTYNDGHVDTGVRVVQIRARTPQIDHPIVVTTADNKKYLARVVIIATNPSTFVNQCSFVPRLPISFQRFGSIAFRGSLSRAIVVYPGPWWRGASFSGFARNVSPTPDKCVSLVYDYCGMQMATEGSRGRDAHAVVCIISGDAAITVANWPEAKRQESVLASLALMFPEQVGLSSTPLAYHDYFPMRQDPYSKGGPTAVYPPGQFCEYSAFRLMKRPLCHSRDGEQRPTIFFSSTETSTSYPGTMEGACARGKEVAGEVTTVLAQIGRRRAGAAEHDTDTFFQEEESGGVVVLEDDQWAQVQLAAGGKRRTQAGATSQ